MGIVDGVHGCLGVLAQNVVGSASAHVALLFTQRRGEDLVILETLGKRSLATQWITAVARRSIVPGRIGVIGGCALQRVVMATECVTES